MCTRSLTRSDDGSATVATVGMISGIVVVLSLLLTGGAVLLEYVTAQNSISAAALNAAEAAVGEREGYPCTMAVQGAKTASAASVSCQVRGHHVRLVWQISVLGFSTELRAQAGAD